MSPRTTTGPRIRPPAPVTPSRRRGSLRPLADRRHGRADPHPGRRVGWPRCARERGVRVNAVCPGWVKTEMDAADQAAGGYSDADIVGQVPMGRFAVPGDIAAAVAFLADPERSGFVNGVALPVDGGWTADAGWTALRPRKRSGTPTDHPGLPDSRSCFSVSRLAATAALTLEVARGARIRNAPG